MGRHAKQRYSARDSAEGGLSLMRWMMFLLAAMGALVLLTWATFPGI